MKKAWYLVFVMASALSVQCIMNDPEQSGDDGSGGSAEETARAYMPQPLAGAEYTWKITRTNLLTAVTDTTTRTESLSGPTPLNGRDMYTITRSPADTRPAWFFFGSNGIMFRIEKSMFAGFELGVVDQDSFGHDYCFFDFTQTSGNKYTVFENGSRTEDHYVNLDIKGWRRGTEPVQSPAGEFSDCVTFQIEISVRYTPVVSGDVQSFRQVETYWFGRAAGLVRRTTEKYSGNALVEQTREELVSLVKP